MPPLLQTGISLLAQLLAQLLYGADLGCRFCQLGSCAGIFELGITIGNCLFDVTFRLFGSDLIHIVGAYGSVGKNVDTSRLNLNVTTGHIEDLFLAIVCDKTNRTRAQGRQQWCVTR